MNSKEILNKLKSLSNHEVKKGMARFKVGGKNTLGVSIPNLRNLAKQIGKSHKFAQRLWASGIHEARILASMIDEPEKVSEKQMDRWVKDFDSWDICDQVCMNLFTKTKFVQNKVIEWSKNEREFIKRASFTIIAVLAVQDKKARDKDFIKFFSIMKREAVDERNFVKKAVNWALRQIGKRNKNLKKESIKTAKEILKFDSKSAKWIANDALRELNKK